MSTLKLNRMEAGTYATPDGRFLVAQGVFYDINERTGEDREYRMWAVIPVHDDGTDGEPLADEFKTKREAAEWLADHLGLSMPQRRRRRTRPTAPTNTYTVVAAKKVSDLKPGDVLLGIYGEAFDRPRLLFSVHQHLGDLWQLVMDGDTDFYLNADEIVGVQKETR